jgi:Xaa-Pro aminopeptidase
LERTLGLMGELGLDILVVASTDSIQHRGNVRYLTNYSTRYGTSLAVIARGGKPVLLVPAGSFQSGWAHATAWVDDIRPVTDFAGAASSLLDQMAGHGATIGLAGFENLPGSIDARITAARPALRFDQVSATFRLMRSIKLDGEIAMSRESIRIADAVLRHVSPALAAGVAESELFARGAHKAALEKAEDSFFLISSGLDNVVMPMPGARALQDRDILRCSVEPAAPGGMWTQTIRVWAVGAPDANVRATHDLCAQALEEAAAMLKPGVTGGDVARTAIQVLKRANGGEIGPLGHGMGLDLVEPPLLLPDDETIVQPGMVVAVHPHLTWRGVSIWIGDTYLVTDGEAARMSTNPLDLLVL